MNQSQVWREGDIINARVPKYPSRQFKLIKLLGEGCEGQVFQAQSINWYSNQYFALKIHFDSERSDYITFIDNIIAYQNQYECNDQNYLPSYIIRIFDKFEYKHPKTQKNQLILVMELGQQELYSLLKQLNKADLQNIQKIIYYVTKSVQFLHANGMFHRDLKPENFMVVGEQIKLIDFGFIKYQINNVRQTPNVGSIVFQAPEVLLGNTNYSQAVDIWSLACVFYEVITNKQLIQYKSRGEYQNWISKKSQQLQKDLHDTISKLGIPETWKTIIKKMLSLESKNRPSIDEVLKIFGNFQTQTEIQPINQQPINQYQNYVPNQVGFNSQQQQQKQRRSITHQEFGPQVDQRVLQTDVQNNQYNQNVWIQSSEYQQPKIIEQQTTQKNLSIIPNIIMLKLQVKSCDVLPKNPQIIQDSNNDFSELHQSIKNQDQSLQKLKQQQIEQNKLIQHYQSELNEIQMLEKTIQENNKNIQNLFNQLIKKQDLNSQIQNQKINYQQLKEIEIQFQSQQNLQSIMNDIKKFKDYHQKLGDQINKDKSMIQEEIQKLIDQIKQLENQIQSERVAVDNCNKDFRNLEIENGTIKLNNMKQSFKINFDKYKDSLFNILNIIQSNQIKLGKLDFLQKKY